MKQYALINKNIVRHNSSLKLAYKNAKLEYGKGKRKPLKSYLGKAVQLSSEILIGSEKRRPDMTSSITSKELLLKLQESKVTGMSGNGYLLFDKIKRFLASDTKDRILIINAVECDPGLVHDEWLLKNRMKEIVYAIDCLKDTLSLNNIILAVKQKNVKTGYNYSVAEVPARYPMGEEHFLMKEILHIPLEKGQYPADFGILVLNLQSIYQISKIINNCYDGGRFITIADLSHAAAKVAYVYPSDNIISILEKQFAHSAGQTAYKGTGIFSCSVASQKEDFSYTGNFAAFSKLPEIHNANKCRNCHRCDRKCPAGIRVSKVVHVLDDNLSDSLLDKSALEKCIQCGICTYYCRASKNVSSYITTALDL